MLDEVTLAYRTYGTLNAEKSNAILICHALTGDQHPYGDNPLTGKPGWWGEIIGPGKPIDPADYFIICSNVIGGCGGSTGPLTDKPDGGGPYGLDFPVITIADMVRAQNLLIDALGIETLFCVIGGSMGGMQVLQWAAAHSERVFSAIPIATSARHSSQNIAFHEVGRQAILADPHFQAGRYYETGERPRKGLGVARMAAHITYLSEAALQRKFGRNLQDREALGFGFDAEFQIESYLRHQGMTFVERFDPIAISTSPRRWIILISPPTMVAIWRPPLPIARRAFASCHLPVIGCSRPRKALPLCGRLMQPGPMSALSRLTAIRAMTLSCSTSRKCAPHWTAFLPRPLPPVACACTAMHRETKMN